MTATIQRAPINPAIVAWARQRAKLTTDELKKAFPLIDEWEAGKINPTVNQLEDFAKKTFTPFGFFFLQDPPKEKIPIKDFRTVGSKAIGVFPPYLTELIYLVQRRQAWLRDYYLENEYPSIDFVGSATVDDKPSEVARTIFELLKIPRHWYRSVAKTEEALVFLQDKIESIGVSVMRSSVFAGNTSLPLDVGVFRGFALVDSVAPVIFVNSRDTKAAQIFTLIHELCHLLLGEEGVSKVDFGGSQGRVESFCNQVTALFLVPSEALSSLSSEDGPVPPGAFDAVGRKLKVSGSVVAYRAYHANKVSKNDLSRYLSIVAKRPMNKTQQGGGTYLGNHKSWLGKRFGTAIAFASASGRIRYTDAFKLTGMKASNFDKFTRSMIPLRR